MTQPMVSKLDRVFNPATVVVVGDKRAQGYMFLRAMLHYRGRLYSVQVDPAEFAGIAELGVSNYASLLDIPGQVDYVVVSVPRAIAPRILQDCIDKKVGGVSFYTSGFAETGTPDGIRLQRDMTEMARQAGIVVIGPNCMGVYNPRMGLCQTPEQPFGDSGPVGFISQSGTHVTNFTMAGARHGIKFSKAVSYGNAIVLDSADYLEYLGNDEATRVIGMYIEGVKDGRRFFRTLREVARKKPVLIWKGGQTAAGARATSSHTGALAESSVVWSAVIRQCGAIEVNSLDEMMDMIKALIHIKPPAGNRVGLVAMSGGQSVVITDGFAKAGLDVPLLTPESYQKLAPFFIIIGGSYKNPFDISSTFLGAKDPLAVLDRMLNIMGEDANIDSVVLEFSAMMKPLRESPQAAVAAITDFKVRTSKSFLVVTTAWHREELALEVRERLAEAGVPSFPSFERAAWALKKIADYYSFQQNYVRI